MKKIQSSSLHSFTQVQPSIIYSTTFPPVRLDTYLSWGELVLLYSKLTTVVINDIVLIFKCWVQLSDPGISRNNNY